MTIETFIAANQTSPIVRGAWLDKERRRPTGGPDTWHTLRYTLANGRTFHLTRANLNELQDRGIQPNWSAPRTPA